MKAPTNELGGYGPIHKFTFVLEDGLRLSVAAWLVGMEAGQPSIKWQRVGPRDERVEALIREPTESLAHAIDLVNKTIDEVMTEQAEDTFYGGSSVV